MEGRTGIDPAVRFGQPRINGTRIPVYMALELLEQGLRAEEIIQPCSPEWTPEDITACLHYAAALLQNEEVSIQELG